MDSELDRTFDPFEICPQWEEYLDEIHAIVEAERIEKMLDEIDQRNRANDLTQEEYERLRKESEDVPF